MNIHIRDRACDGCHRIFPIGELEQVYEHCHVRMLCPDCLPHSKPEALTFPDRPVAPMVDAVFEEAAQ